MVQGVDESCNLKSDVPHPIFLIRRVEKFKLGDPGYLQYFAVETITSHVLQKLRLKLMEATQEELLRVYELFEPVAASRLLAGVIFETIGQRQLQKEVALTLVPMKKDPPTPGRRLTQWISQFLRESRPEDDLPIEDDLPTEDSDSVGATATDTSLPISFKPQGTIQYPKPRPSASEIGSGIYYVPESPNQAAFDSFIVEDGVLHIFQFTIEASHTISAGLMDFFSHKSFKAMLQGKEWYFIFVIPRGGNVTFSESSDEKMEWFWKNANFFTAEMDPKKKQE
jgi:hypothetical protein